MDSVKDYYGKKLTSTDDLQATAVTSCARKTEAIPAFVKEALSKVHNDIASKAYGCSTGYPEALHGTKILDLGSGCGRDCFVLSQLVGEEGGVVGLDMTDELLELSRDKIPYHTQAFGYAKANVSFVKGYLEKMGEAGLEDGYFDVIVSNCVISLCKDKKAVLKEAYRVLKPGGEMYFSDMYRQGTLPAEAKEDPLLWCEGLAGSLAYTDLHSIAQDLGFCMPRLVKADDLPVLDQGVKAKLGGCEYAACTYRLYKRPEVEAKSGVCDVTYKGGIQGYEEQIKFDARNTFKKGETKVTDGELGDILRHSRYSRYFDVSPTQSDTQPCPMDVDPFKLIAKPSCGQKT